MPQGILKKVSGGGKNTKTKKSPATVKRKTVTKEQKLLKKTTSKHRQSTEKMLASKVGHLELLKGTRRELEETKKAAAKVKGKPKK